MQVVLQPGHWQKEPLPTGKAEAEPHPVLVQHTIMDAGLASSGKLLEQPLN